MLRPEMYATVEITVDERRALAIPRSALLRLGDATVVFLETGAAPDGRTKFERVPLTVDEGESSRWLPVLQGLEPGSRVVTAGAVLLSGML
jgi:multidrug efflux pump subunit AcrA (membrane-fusion protein)